MRNVQNTGFKHCMNNELTSVLVRGSREVGEIVVRIADGRRVVIHGSILVELLGLTTCVEGGLGQIAKQIVLVRSALDLRFQVGKMRQEVVDVKVSEVVVGSGLEVTVKEQQGRQEQGRVKHEKGEGEMLERSRHAHCKHP